MVLWYCRTAHVEEYDEPLRRKDIMQKKYEPIAKYQLKKLKKIFSEEELREHYRQEHDNMWMQTQHWKYRTIDDKWVDETKAWFKDDADI